MGNSTAEAAAIRALITPTLLSIAESDQDADRLLEVLRPLKHLLPGETEAAFQAHAVLLRVIRQALSELGVADECFLRVLNHLADYLLTYDLMYPAGHGGNGPRLLECGAARGR